METHVGCSRLKDVLDQALADGQNLGELALNLHSTIGNLTSVSHALTQWICNTCLPFH
jgi:hypothetical protein